MLMLVLVTHRNGGFGTPAILKRMPSPQANDPEQLRLQQCVECMTGEERRVATL